MKVLITGSQGYIGAVLGPYLQSLGHRVSGVDSGYYVAPLFYGDASEQPAAVARDVRKLEAADFDGYDAVIHLAGLSNDPLGALLPALTREINFEGALNAARVAREAGVKRFIDFSSCSVYGATGAAARTELDATGPLTEYARCKVLLEQALADLASDSFTVVSMRNATVFGPSPRMRFDLVLNNLAGYAWTTGEVKLLSDGSPWRPLIHVRDLSRAAARMLDAPAAAINREVFNVGDDRSNHQVREIAHAVARAFPDSRISIGESGGDDRSYQVSFAKIRRVLDFTCEQDIEQGAAELRDLFEQVALTREMFDSPRFSRLKRIRTLISSGEVDDNLFWLASPEGRAGATHTVSA